MKASTFILLFAPALVHAAPVYQLHEWGTFTTVSGSDGKLLSGLQREEESLPAYVHSHTGFENGKLPNPSEMQRILRLHGTLGIGATVGSKGLDGRPVSQVTVKMETPVIYFHSQETEPIRVKVKVGFQGGTISQWYPQRSGGETLPEPPPSKDPVNKPTPREAWNIDFSKPYRGDIEWNIDILSPAATRDTVVFKPDDNLGWLRARQPATNAIRNVEGGETESYLFYRGLGKFNPGLKTTISADEILHVSNNTGKHIPYLVVFEKVDGKVRWTELKDGLGTQGSIAFDEASMKTEETGFAQPLYLAMKTGLAKQGLTDAEAASMVETWWHSYFEAPGLRVFWVVPRETTDTILPLSVSPAPSEIVRVIVGRSEVLRPRDEVKWLAASRKTGEDADAWTNVVVLDRFGLAIQERVKSLSLVALHGQPAFSMFPASTVAK